MPLTVSEDSRQPRLACMVNVLLPPNPTMSVPAGEIVPGPLATEVMVRLFTNEAVMVTGAFTGGSGTSALLPTDTPFTVTFWIE